MKILSIITVSLFISCSPALVKTILGITEITEEYSNIPEDFGKKKVEYVKNENATSRKDRYKASDKVSEFVEIKPGSIDFIFPDSITIVPGSTRKMGSGHPEDEFRKFFVKNFFEKIRDKYNLFIINAMEKEDIELTEKKPKTYRFSKDNFVRDYFPENGEIKGLKNRYAIIIESMLFGSASNTTTMQTGSTSVGPKGAGISIPTYSTSTSKYSGIKAVYYIWDNQEKRIITFVERHHTISDDDIEDIEGMIHEFADIFFKATAFDRYEEKIYPEN